MAWVEEAVWELSEGLSDWHEKVPYFYRRKGILCVCENLGMIMISLYHIVKYALGGSKPQNLEHCCGSEKVDNLFISMTA